MLPIPHQTQPLELLALHLHIMPGVGAACLTQLRHRHAPTLPPELLRDGVLDGHTMIVPAGHIGCAVAPHRIGAHDDVLQHLVERVPHVDIAVGVRGSVVQDEIALRCRFLQHALIEAQLVPERLPARLLFWQVRPHRDRPLLFGQIERLSIVASHTVKILPHSHPQARFDRGYRVPLVHAPLPESSGLARHG
jgi:hypothetical protein